MKNLTENTQPNPKRNATPSILRSLAAGAALSLVALDASAHDYTELLPTFPSPTAAFGGAVDVLGDYAAIGASSYGGTVYLMTRAGDGWSLRAKLQPDQDYADAHFGADVAFFGEWLAIGAPGDDELANDAGAVYLYRLNVNSNSYLHHSTVYSPSPGSGLGSFGLALAGEGSTLVVGEPGVTGVDLRSGAAHMFQFNGDDWNWRQRLDATGGANQNFGWSVAMDDGAIAIGAPTWDDAQPGTGKVSLFHYDVPLGGWARSYTLHPEYADEFGRALALQEGQLMVGAPGTLVGQSETGVLVGYSVTALTAQDAGIYPGVQDGERLGESLTIGRDPSGVLRIAAGAPRDDDGGLQRGAVQILEAFGLNNWIPVTRLHGDATADSAWLGTDVCFDGYQVLGGAPLDEVGGERGGSVRRFDVSSGAWSEAGSLVGRAVDDGDRFGGDVAIHGDLAVVGARGDSDIIFGGGSAYVFERVGGEWRHVASLSSGTHATPRGEFGDKVATDGERILVGAHQEGDYAGAAYVFERNGSGRWVMADRLVASDGASNHYFGTAITIDGDTAVIGATQADGGGPDSRSGAAYVFRRDGSGSWNEVQKLGLPGAGASSDIGYSVAVDVDAGELFVGALGEGMLLRFNWNGFEWAPALPILPGAGQSDSQFGRGLSLHGEHLAVAASENLDVGVIHLYRRIGGDWGFREAIVHDGTYFGTSMAYDGERLAAGSHRVGTILQRFDMLWQDDTLEPQSFMTGYPLPIDLSGAELIFGDDGSRGGHAWIYELDTPGPFLAYGFGDGSGNACPCGNESAPDSGEGCMNTSGRGALLRAEGTPGIGSDDLVVVGEGFPPGRTARLFVGVRRLLGVPFGDGQRLVGTPLRRLTVRQAGPDGSASWSVNHGIGFWLPGDTRYFQAFYRDVAGGVCGNGFNTSSGLAVLMAP